MAATIPEKAEIVVIGGGPAGSTAASFLAKHGRQVVLLEKEKFPRHHIGESLLPGLVRVLDIELGVGDKIQAAGFRVKTGASFVWGSDRTPWSIHFWEIMHKGRTAYQVERAKFDKLLLDHTRSLGVDVREESVVERVIFEGERAGGLQYRDGSGEEHIVNSKFAIDASGLGCLTGRQRNIRRIYERVRNVAVYGYWKCDELPYEELGGDITPLDESNILVVSDERCWIWFIPLSGGMASIGVVFPLQDLNILQSKGSRDFYLGKLQNCKEASHLLRNAQFVEAEPLRILKDWSQICESLCGPGYFLTGDAAAFVDPILSSGVTLAVSFGAAAGRAVNTLLEHGEANSWVYTWYQHAYTTSYNDFRRAADFWYLGNPKREDWFQVVHASVKESIAREVDERKAFILLAAGTLTTGEFLDRECYVDSSARPIMVYFTPVDHGGGFFLPHNRRFIAAHLGGVVPKEMTLPTFASMEDATSLGPSGIHGGSSDSMEQPLLNKDVRIAVFSKAGTPFLSIAAYLAGTNEYSGKHSPLSPGELAFLKLLCVTRNPSEVEVKSGLAEDRVKSYLAELKKAGLLSESAITGAPSGS